MYVGVGDVYVQWEWGAPNVRSAGREGGNVNQWSRDNEAILMVAWMGEQLMFYYGIRDDEGTVRGAKELFVDKSDSTDVGSSTLPLSMGVNTNLPINIVDHIGQTNLISGWFERDYGGGRREVEYSFKKEGRKLRGHIKIQDSTDRREYVFVNMLKQ